MYGLNTNPVLPVRKEAHEQSEMTTQLLFGEVFSIDEKTEKWYHIFNYNDKYTGWVDKKMITKIVDNSYTNFTSDKPDIIFKSFAECKLEKDPIILPAGSFIHSYNKEKQTFILNDKTYSIPVDFLFKNNQQASGETIIDIAKSFLNAPYLWGGKTIFGIDCSGLTQVCFSICGIQLPRDASQQIMHGDLVDFLQEAVAGDLAFFENEEGKICHVGILINKSTIIHASGKVRIDSIDNLGIKTDENGKYSHKLRLIKRIL